MVNRSDIYNSGYFNAAYGIYHDIPKMWYMVDRIKDLQPDNVLELGCANGFVVKHLEDLGIPTKGIDVSNYCYLNRATHTIKWDLVDIPWPIGDKEFDVCFSNETLECIPPEHIDAVISEINRVSKRGLHVIDFDDEHKIPKNITQPNTWWESKFAGMDHKLSKFEELPGALIKSLTWNNGTVKMNLGSWTKMFYHGWINVDTSALDRYAKFYNFKFIQMDVTEESAPSNSITAMAAFDFFNHLSFEKCKVVLASCWESLMAGGIIRIGVPDIAKLIMMYKNNELSMFDDLNDDIKNAPYSNKLFNLLAGHKSFHDIDTIVNLLRNAGFTRIEKVNFRESRSKQIKLETIDSLPDMSLYVEASKFVL